MLQSQIDPQNIYCTQKNKIKKKDTLFPKTWVENLYIYIFEPYIL